jgi:RNA recognition motif-containing protein
MTKEAEGRATVRPFSSISMANRQATTLYIGNLPDQVDEQEFRQFVELGGTVVSLTFGCDRRGRENFRFAFVQFSTPEVARSALTRLKRSDFRSRPLRVSPMLPTDDRFAEWISGD